MRLAPLLLALALAAPLHAQVDTTRTTRTDSTLMTGPVYRVVVTNTVTITGGPGTTPPTAGAWLSEWFNYPNTAALMASPLYSNEDAYNTDKRITLVSDSAGGSRKAMRYTLGPVVAPCQETTVGRNLRLPDVTREVWIEAWVKFSANWTTRASCSGSNPDYKFVLGRIHDWDGNRFDILIGNGGNSIHISWPGHEEAGAVPMAPGFQVFDGQWHRHRLHWKLSTTGQSDGGAEYWIDGVLVYRNLASSTGPAADIYGVALARTLNQGPPAGVTMSVTWGAIQAYKSNPGW